MIKYLGKSDNIVKAIQKMPGNKKVTHEAMEKIVKYADEAGIVLNKTSDLLKQGEKIIDSGNDCWNMLGSVSTGIFIDQRFDKHGQEMVKGIRGLGITFPVFDRIDNGVLISTKSINLYTITYKDARAIERTLSAMESFEKKYSRLSNLGYLKWGDEILYSYEYSGKVLEIVIPDIPISEAQKAILQKYSEFSNIKIVILKG